MTAAVLAPADAMSTAISDAYDQLRQLVEKFAGRRDDPELLEEVGSVRRRALGKYNRAKKKAEPPAPAEKQRAEPAPVKPAEPKAVPAAAAPQPAERVTVKLSEPASPQRQVAEREKPAGPPAAEQPRGKHREPRKPWWARRPLPWRAHALIVALLVLGTAGAFADRNPVWVVGGFVLAMVVHAVAPRNWRRSR